MVYKSGKGLDEVGYGGSCVRRRIVVKRGSGGVIGVRGLRMIARTSLSSVVRYRFDGREATCRCPFVDKKNEKLRVVARKDKGLLQHGNTPLPFSHLTNATSQSSPTSSPSPDPSPTPKSSQTETTPTAASISALSNTMTCVPLNRH